MISHFIVALGVKFSIRCFVPGELKVWLWCELSGTSLVQPQTLLTPKQESNGDSLLGEPTEGRSQCISPCIGGSPVLPYLSVVRNQETRLDLCHVNSKSEQEVGMLALYLGDGCVAASRNCSCLGLQPSLQDQTCPRGFNKTCVYGLALLSITHFLLLRATSHAVFRSACYTSHQQV